MNACPSGDLLTSTSQLRGSCEAKKGSARGSAQAKEGLKLTTTSCSQPESRSTLSLTARQMAEATARLVEVWLSPRVARRKDVAARRAEEDESRKVEDLT
jgi:hypothetical protein